MAENFPGWALRAALSVCFVLPAFPATSTEDSKVLNVYNWADYIGNDTIRNFEKETGIRVNYDNFEANEVLHAKLRAGHTGYDIVVPSVHWAKRQIEGHLLLKLDKSKITTYANLDPWIMRELAAGGDDGNDYLVPWLWGYTTLGINVDKVRGALGSMQMPENSWDLLFKPEYSTRLGACGLSLLDSGDDVFGAALHYLGLEYFSKRREDYLAAAALLAKLRPNVTLFSSTSYINGLADGSLCIALGYSGDIAVASVRAAAAHVNVKIFAGVPKSGSLLYIDSMAIPADAPHVENAYTWMSYIFRPEVQAEIVNTIVHANPVRAADGLVRPALRATSGLYPTSEEIARLVPPRTIPDDVLRFRARLFTTFKSGL